MKPIFLFFGLLCLTTSASGQTTFHKKWDNRIILDACPLNDGGALLAGYYTPRTSLAVRLDPTGEIMWSKTLSPIHIIWDVLEVADGYIIAGDSLVPDGPNEYARFTIISKLSPAGEVIWSQALGGFNLDIRSRQLTRTDNGFIYSGIELKADFLMRVVPMIIRFDHLGQVIWSKSYSTQFPTFNSELFPQYIEGDTLYAAGDVHGNACFMRLDLRSGEMMDWRTFGGIFVERISSIFPLPDGNFLLAGSTLTTTGSEQGRIWLVKTSRTGEIIWSKTYDMPGMNQRAFMAAGDDGNFVFSTGAGSGNGGSTEIPILCKITPDGEILWAYDYSGGSEFFLQDVQQCPDGGYLSVGSRTNLLKTDAEGRVLNGCCPAPVNFEINDFYPPYQNYPLETADWDHFHAITVSASPDTLFNYRDFCETEVTSLTHYIEVCQGDSALINGAYYLAPQTIRDTVYSTTGGCDTVVVYHLLSVPLPFRLQSVGFCQGTSVELNGQTYTEPAYVTQYLPAATGCDTQLVYNLFWTQLPKRFETTYFCPGDSVVVDGIAYFYPTNFLSDTLPGTGNDCDTLLFHFIAYHDEPSALDVQCPPSLSVDTDPGVPAQVAYSLPSGVSTCTCPDISLTLEQGLPSGALFPAGQTEVCYTVGDVCGATTPCCFTVNVVERAACDTKESGCVKYELLGVFLHDNQQRTYQLRVTNQCQSALNFLVIEIPDGTEAVSPADNSLFLSNNGREYVVRNPNLAPFRSLRFKSNGPGLSGGQSDIFNWTLPPQSAPTFFKAHARLFSGAVHEILMNTFNCEMPAENRQEAPSLKCGLAVYPNPAQNEITVTFDRAPAANAMLHLLDTSGRPVVAFPVPAGRQTLALSVGQAPGGVYFLEFTPENGQKERVKLLLFD